MCKSETRFQEEACFQYCSLIIFQKCNLKESQTSPGAISQSTREKTG